MDADVALTVRVARIMAPITVLGPGSRVGLWVQGCALACPGCASRDTWDPGGGHAVDVSRLLGLAFMPSALLPLAAAGVVVVQLAGAGTGYLPGDVSVTVTMVMVTMIVFAVTAAFSRRLGASR